MLKQNSLPMKHWVFFCLASSVCEVVFDETSFGERLSIMSAAKGC